MCVCVEEEGGDTFVYRGSLSVCVKGAGNVFVHRCQKCIGWGSLSVCMWRGKGGNVFVCTRGSFGVCVGGGQCVYKLLCIAMVHNA